MNRDSASSLPPSIISRIGLLHIRIRKECDRIFREQEFPLEMDQTPVLMILFYQESLTQHEICSKLDRDKASVNRTVTFLTQRGLVKVKPDDTDKRKTRVELTTEGKKLGKRASIILEAFGKQLSSAFTDEENKEFDRLTTKLAQVIAAPGCI